MHTNRSHPNATIACSLTMSPSAPSHNVLHTMEPSIPVPEAPMSDDMSDVVALYNCILEQRLVHMMSNTSVSPSQEGRTSMLLDGEEESRMMVDDHLSHSHCSSYKVDQMMKVESPYLKSLSDSHPQQHCGSHMIMSSTKRFPKLPSSAFEDSPVNEERR